MNVRLKISNLEFDGLVYDPKGIDIDLNVVWPIHVDFDRSKSLGSAINLSVEKDGIYADFDFKELSKDQLKLFPSCMIVNGERSKDKVKTAQVVCLGLVTENYADVELQNLESYL